MKKAALLSGGVGVSMTFPPSIQKALAINPNEGTTFEDAEHIVLLMQENRSFDHCFGTLKGVRGYNDPRAINLPNKNPVWLQSDKAGNTYVPFRLNMRETNATWLGDLPHSWENQVDARNNGKYDKWLEAKKLWRKESRHIPLTLGHYNRQDIPFYYAFADAFTVFDQHFCSSLTGTTTNRLFFWTGTHKGSPEALSNVRNSEVYYNKEAKWKTFPERLEENGISWRVYQNEVSIQTELKGEDSSLLGNFTDNNLEWFTQFNIRYAEGHQKFLKKRFSELPSEIEALKKQIERLPKGQVQKHENELEKKQKQYQKIKEELAVWNPDNYDRLSAFEKSIHQRAFTTNSSDPDYLKTEPQVYNDNGTKREFKVPKGDILHQFRTDVDSGNLPTVSWLVAPQKFSDHPSAPWYGAWYVSEVLDILTKNPEVWKKTIFILNYDENDGYFDHVPPFVAPDPRHKNAMSEGLDTRAEYVTIEEELKKEGMNPEYARESPVGLGYRVPLVVASPWTKGGWVNSQVCDITSTIQFMEKFLSKKTGKKLEETNISSWRRTVSGDLTSAFRPYNSSEFNFDNFVDRNELMQEIYSAGFKSPPSNFKPLGTNEIEQARQDLRSLSQMPVQEEGIKDSCALPYELYADGILDKESRSFKVSFTAADAIFGSSASGAPFNVYAPEKYLQKDADGGESFQPVKTWAYAVKAGDRVSDDWSLQNFEDNKYHLKVYGPNGFYREFSGSVNDPEITMECTYEKTGRFIKKLSGNIVLKLTNNAKKKLKITIKDHAYKNPEKKVVLKKGAFEDVVIESAKSYGWYDFSVLVEGDEQYERRFAGRVETGQASKTDPFMGRVV